MAGTRSRLGVFAKLSQLRNANIAATRPLSCAGQCDEAQRGQVELGPAGADAHGGHVGRDGGAICC